MELNGTERGDRRHPLGSYKVLLLLLLLLLVDSLQYMRAAAGCMHSPPQTYHAASAYFR